MRIALPENDIPHCEVIMKIIDHRLHTDDGEPLLFRSSPNCGSQLDPQYVVMHYTAGRNAKQSIKWLLNGESRASAHVVIGRDGQVTQLVPFDTIAWHCGTSTWNGRSRLNRYSIGIELDNAGRLVKHGRAWHAWFGDKYDEGDVYVGPHKHETGTSGWHTYSARQMDVSIEVVSAIVNHYRIREVVGHEDISPGRKVDPGPAFPMGSFTARVLGRDDDSPEEFETTTVLNIRSGPGTRHDTIPGAPLPAGTRLFLLERSGSWCMVDVDGEVNGVMDIQGWVHGRYVRRMERA